MAPAPSPVAAALLDAGAIGACAIGFAALGAEVLLTLANEPVPAQAVLRSAGAIGALAIGDGALGAVEMTAGVTEAPAQEVHAQGLLATRFGGPHTAQPWYGPAGGLALVRFGAAALQLQGEGLGLQQPLAQFGGAVAAQVFAREQGMAPQTRFGGALLVQVVHAAGTAPTTSMGGLSAGSVAGLRGAGPLAQLGPLSAQLVAQAQGMPSRVRFGGATALGKSEAITEGYQGTQYGQLAVARTTVFAHSLPPTTRFSQHQLQWGQRC
ncbi:hypothetical protein [Comamonas aquatica]|uniref:hypothetical protein n=1 Tax=Comamonas aquatica TaxID=225991 RepID=UPI001B36C43B|nr:hypothetical protein [Comamonas aquatica]QTX22146.1 hypothetical protein KAQ61_06850 [Comamonas aquatica]